MANQQDGRGGRTDQTEGKDKSGQGTGKHAHKSAAEPYPHTKDGGRDDERREAGGRQASSNRDQERGQDKKSGAAQQSSEQGNGARQDQARGQQAQGQKRQDQSDVEKDLKRREYEGPDGEIHHHTKTYMDQHKGEGQRGGESGDGQRGG